MHLVLQKTTRASITYCGLVGLSLLAASCGGGREPIAPQVIGSLSISPSSPSPIPSGGTLQLSVSIRDTQGQPMSGQAVTYVSSAPSIATVSDQGVVSAIGPLGTADITASAGGKTATVSVSVVAGAATSLTRTSADPATVSAGATAGDSVRYRITDAFGNPRTNETVTFTVAAGNGQVSPATAQTDGQGRVATRFRTGTTAGQNTLTATVASVTPNSFTLTTVPSSVAISSISPSPITPGATVTINGSGFSATTTDDVVNIDGVAATVTSASSTQLTVVAPASLPCSPAHTATVEVSVNGTSGFAQQAVRAGTLRAVPLGGAVLISSAADLACTELSPGNAQYTVSVLNTSSAPADVTPFRFTGRTTVTTGASPLTSAFVVRQSMNVSPPRRPATAMERQLQERAAAHNWMLEANRTLYRELKRNPGFTPRRSVAATSPALRASLSLSLTAAIPAVGETRTLRVNQSSIGGAVSCSNYVEITAKAVYVGTKGIIWEDVVAPLAGQMDSYFAQLGQEFDATMYRSDSTYFSDPLLTDPNTDADQHLSMVFSPAIPANLSGFVISCDFFPRNTTNNQGSNFGEYFYATVPTVAGTGFNGNTADQWLRGIRGTIVHEVKHIAMIGSRLEQNASSFEESWLEEGMAMTAEEVWARNNIYVTAWKGNADYRSTIYCDVRPTPCPGAPFVVFDHFSKLYDFLTQGGGLSLFGRVDNSDFTFYGTSWSFIRWNTDRYASSELSFLRGITQAFDVTGMANMARQTGANPEQMLGMWSLSLYLDENTATAANPDLTFPSWNLRDIFRGMSTDFPNSFPGTYPFASQSIAVGDFTVDNAGIHGGSYAIYDLTGVVANTRAVSLAPSSAPIPGLRLVIARIQ